MFFCSLCNRIDCMCFLHFHRVQYHTRYIKIECIKFLVERTLNKSLLHVMHNSLYKRERGKTVLFTVLSDIDLFATRIVHLLFFLPSAISSLVTRRRTGPTLSQEKNRSYVRQEVADERRATKKKEIGFQR